MKTLLMIMAGAMLTLSIHGGDLTAHWVAEQRPPNGPVRETSLWIVCHGQCLHRVPMERAPRQSTNR